MHLWLLKSHLSCLAIYIYFAAGLKHTSQVAGQVTGQVTDQVRVIGSIIFLPRRYINKINKINYGSTGSHKSCHHEYNLLGTWLKATKMADSSEAENKVGSNLNVKFIVCALPERRHILKLKVNNGV